MVHEFEALCEPFAALGIDLPTTRNAAPIGARRRAAHSVLFALAPHHLLDADGAAVYRLFPG